MLACCALLVAGAASAQAPAPIVAEEGDRALERALARQSVLVLPRGAVELEPSLEYAYRGTEGLEIVDVTGTAQVAQQDVKQDRLEARVALRVGLPGAAHVEVRAPYVFLREERATASQFSSTTSESDAGDLEIGITKSLVEERPGNAGWLASLNWRIPTGPFRLGEVSPSSGFHALQGGVTFVKRQDPLVFFGTATYTHIDERTHEGAAIDPGNTFGLKAGGILAASPRSSVRAAFEVIRGGNTRVDGVEAPGSDTVAATLQLGLGMLLTSRNLLDVQFGIGVTEDAPDFTITVALPIRFL